MKPFEVFKTHTFKLHNLSKKKKSYLDKTFRQSEMAYFKALNAVRYDADGLIKLDTKERKQGLAEIKKKISQIVKPLPYGNAVKSSVIEDVAAQVSSYIELIISGQNAGYPTRIEAEYEYHEALMALLSSTHKEDEDKAKSDMARAARCKIRPLSFCRYRESGGFMLLSDKKGRVFTFVNLWSSKDKRATKLQMDMVDTRTGKEYRKSTSTGLLLPLEFSDWHKEALSKGRAQSAKLYEKNGDYFLAVAFKYSVDRINTSEFVMGIDRGIDEIATYAVRDKTGKVVAFGSFDGKVLREHQRKLENKQKMGQKRGKALVSAWSNYSDNLVQDVNGAINIAGKKLWLTANKGKFKKVLPDHMKFNVWQSNNLSL